LIPPSWVAPLQAVINDLVLSPAYSTLLLG